MPDVQKVKVFQQENIRLSRVSIVIGLKEKQRISPIVFDNGKRSTTLWTITRFAHNDPILHVHARESRLATCSILQHDINLRFAEVLDAEGDKQAREN